MVEFTLFEIHLDGADFTANAPFNSAGETTEDDSAGALEAGDDAEGGGIPVGKVVLAVAVVAVVTVAVRKVLGGGDEADE